MKHKSKPPAPQEPPHTCQFCRWRYTEVEAVPPQYEKFTGIIKRHSYANAYFCRFNPPQAGSTFPLSLGATAKDSTCSKWEKEVADATEAPKAEKLPKGVKFHEDATGELFPDLSEFQKVLPKTTPRPSTTGEVV